MGGGSGGVAGAAGEAPQQLLDEEEGCVFVEHEAEPWQTQNMVGVEEWKGWFDASGRLKSYDKLRNRSRPRRTFSDTKVYEP